MRRLVVALASVCLMAGPATVALAADSNREQIVSIAAHFPLSKAEPLDLAQRQVDRATDRVKERQEQIRERREAAGSEAGDEGSAGEGQGSTPTSPQLQAIAQCESGGDYGAVDPSGTYYGAYQFDQSTWESVGGSGSPAAASPAEQDKRAQMLLERSGASPWPVCGS